MPSFEELKKEFGENNVSTIFDGRPWEKHDSCVGMDETSGDRDFLVEYFGREISSEDAIAEMVSQGYRPATPVEAIAFAKAHPELQRQFWIVALGSFAMNGDDRLVAVLDAGAGGLYLGDACFVGAWDVDFGFLFLRKDTGNLGTSDTGTLDDWEEERRKAWDEYLAAEISKEFPRNEKMMDAYFEGCALVADRMLTLRDIRFPKPYKK